VQNKHHQRQILSPADCCEPAVATLGVHPNGSQQELEEEAEEAEAVPEEAEEEEPPAARLQPLPPACQHQLPPRLPSPPTRQITAMTDSINESSFAGGSLLNASFLDGVSIDLGELMHLSS
jgi:hypothetical protein